jgi:hypothetical protein
MVRAEMSEHELLSSDAPISQIASNSGFSDRAHYVKSFTEWFGATPETFRREFSKTTILHREPQIEMLSLEEIDMLFGEDAPGASRSEATAIVHIAVRNKGAARVPDAPRFSSFSAQADQYARRSFNVCVKTLDRIAEGKGAIPPEKITPYDTRKSDGLFMKNGLKKPLYYLCEFLSRLFDEVVSRTPGRIITVSDGRVRGILYAPRGEASQEYVISFPDLTGRYALRLRHLTEKENCVSLCGKLGVSETLSAEDFHTVASASSPKTEILSLDDVTKYELTYRTDDRSIMYFQLDPIRGGRRALRATRYRRLSSNRP